MEIQRGWEVGFERGDDARFTGEAWLRSGLAAEDGTNVGVVHFAPGARTRWHRHAGGQFLYCVTGRGRVRSRNQEGHRLQPGDIVHARPGEWHFHGADDDAPMVHLVVNGLGQLDWGEPVTAEEYADGF
jgi:quercetin dioxygenase-like cupin family protein